MKNSELWKELEIAKGLIDVHCKHKDLALDMVWREHKKLEVMMEAFALLCEDVFGKDDGRLLNKARYYTAKARDEIWKRAEQKLKEKNNE